MNEKEAKKWVKKSIVTTSDDFTDKLMERLESKPVVVKTFVWPFKTIFCLILTVMLSVSYLIYKNFDSSYNLFSADIDISGTHIFLGTTILFLLALNHVLKLNETYKSLKNAI